MKGPWLNLLLSRAALGGGAAPANSAPVNTIAPTLSGSTALGGVITCDPGTWSGYPFPTYTYVHKRDGVAISGATSQSYTVVLADQGTSHTCDVTGLNTQGSSTATTAGLAIPAGADTTPDPFTFTDITNAALSTVYTSNAITVAGINAAATISITGGTYAVNGGSYTSAPGSVVLGDSVAVRVTSSGSNSTAVNAVLTIGGVSDTYTVTTLAGAGALGDTLDFSDSTNSGHVATIGA